MKTAMSADMMKSLIFWRGRTNILKPMDMEMTTTLIVISYTVFGWSMSRLETVMRTPGGGWVTMARAVV